MRHRQLTTAPLVEEQLAAAGPEDRHLALQLTDDLASVRHDWELLASQTTSVFATWDWSDAWVRHLGQDAELAVGLARHPNGRPRVLLPLYLARRRPIRLLRFIGAGPSDELGPICAPEDLALAADLLRQCARGLMGERGLFLAERLQGERGIAAELGGTQLRRASTPLVRIDGASFEEFLASRSRNFRSQLRRAERRLVREHKLVYRLTEDEDSLERDLWTLVRLHERRWRDGQSHAFAGARKGFQIEFARRAFANRWLRLWTMELDGQPAASWYGLRYGGVDHYYQAGRDPRFAPLKLGFVLLGHTIRCACEDGMREYRFGLGDESYKGRFTEIDPGLQTVALASGTAGGWALKALQAGLFVRDRARALRGG